MTDPVLRQVWLTGGIPTFLRCVVWSLMHCELRLFGRTLLRIAHLATAVLVSSMGTYRLSFLDGIARGIAVLGLLIVSQLPTCTLYFTTCVAVDVLSGACLAELMCSADSFWVDAPLAWLLLRAALIPVWRARQTRLSISLSSELFLAFGVGEHEANARLQLFRTHGCFFHTEVVLENTRYLSNTYSLNGQLMIEERTALDGGLQERQPAIEIPLYLSFPRHISFDAFHSHQRYGFYQNCQVSCLRVLLRQSWSEAFVVISLMLLLLSYSLPCLLIAGSLSRIYNAGYERLADIIDFCQIWLARSMTEARPVGTVSNLCEHWRWSLRLPELLTHDPTVVECSVTAICSMGTADFTHWTLHSSDITYESCTAKELLDFLEYNPSGSLFLQALLEQWGLPESACLLQEFFNCFRAACNHSPLVRGGNLAQTCLPCSSCIEILVDSQLPLVKQGRSIIAQLRHTVEEGLCAFNATTH